MSHKLHYRQKRCCVQRYAASKIFCELLYIFWRLIIKRVNNIMLLLANMISAIYVNWEQKIFVSVTPRKHKSFLWYSIDDTFQYVINNHYIKSHCIYSVFHFISDGFVLNRNIEFQCKNEIFIRFSKVELSNSVKSRAEKSLLKPFFDKNY